MWRCITYFATIFVATLGSILFDNECLCMCIYTCIIIMDDPQLQWRLLSISITVPITLPMLLLSMFFPWKGVLFNYISSRRRRSLRAPHYRRANQMAQLGAEAGDQGRRPARPPPPGRWWPCAPGGGPPALGSGSGPAASSLQTRQSAAGHPTEQHWAQPGDARLPIRWR